MVLPVICCPAQKQQSTATDGRPAVFFMHEQVVVLDPALAAETPHVEDWDGQAVSSHLVSYATHGHMLLQAGSDCPHSSFLVMHEGTPLVVQSELSIVSPR